MELRGKDSYSREKPTQRSQRADIFLQWKAFVTVTGADNEVERLLERLMPIRFGGVDEMRGSHLRTLVSVYDREGRCDHLVVPSSKNMIVSWKVPEGAEHLP